MIRTILFSLVLMLLIGCTTPKVKKNNPHPDTPTISHRLTYLYESVRVYDTESFNKWTDPWGIDRFLPRVEWDPTNAMWIRQRLAELNKWVNYISDGEGNYYQKRIETLQRRGGDCEDLSIITATYLRWCGYPKQILIMYGKVDWLADNNHLWVYLPEDDRIIENSDNNGSTMWTGKLTMRTMLQTYIVFYSIRVN